MAFEWAVTPALDSPLALDRSILDIPWSAISPGNYSVAFTASKINDGSESSTATLQLSYMASELSVVIPGGEQSIGIGNPFTVNATAFDPDDPTAHPKEDFVYKWSGSGVEVLLENTVDPYPDFFLKQAILDVEALYNILPTGSHEFIVEVSKGGRSLQASSSVNIVPGNPPGAAIECLTCPEGADLTPIVINANSKLVLGALPMFRGRFIKESPPKPDTLTSITGFEWTVLGEDKSVLETAWGTGALVGETFTLNPFATASSS